MGQKTLWDSLKRLAKDGWITIKPNGRRNKGQSVLLGENGEILGGMGGKFNGLKMKDVKDTNKKLKQKNEYAKSGHSKGESPELYNVPIPSAAANAPAIPGASNTPAATTTPSSVSSTPSQATSASGEILPSQKGNLKDYKNFTGYDKLNMTSKMVLDDAVQSLQKAMSDMNLDVADMAKVTKGVQTALSKSVDGKLGADVQHMLTAAKNAAKSLYGSKAYNDNMVKALKYAKQIEQQPMPAEVQQKEAAKQAEYQKQQEFKNTHSYTQQTTDADRKKFKQSTDKFLSDEARANVAAIPTTLQNGKFIKTKHKNKFEQELGEGGESFKRYSGMAYGLMNSSDKSLAIKAQNIAVAVANGQMEGSEAISLLRSMDAMGKVKDYTDPKNEPPAFTSIHNDAIHDSGVFKASSLSQSIKNAIKEYTGPAYAQINGALRTGKKLGSNKQNVVNKLNEAFARPEVKAKENFTVYRGITSSQLQHLAMGSTMTDKGLVSTSSSANEAKKFAGADGALMEIRVKKGQPAMSVKNTSVFPSEMEVLLPANTSFKVVGKKIGPEGRPVLIVDYVPPANLAKDRALTYLQRAGWVSTPKDDAQRCQAIFDALRRM
jgi:hypothetical protein